MAWGVIYHDQQMMVAISLPYLFQEHLKTSAIGAGEVHTEALSAARLHRRIQVGPFVYSTYYARWSKPKRAVAPSLCQFISPKRASSNAITFKGLPECSSFSF